MPERLACTTKMSAIEIHLPLPFNFYHHGRTFARVYPVHLTNVERRQAAADPQTKPNDLGCESMCRLPESTPTIAIYYYYSARKLILITSGYAV